MFLYGNKTNTDILLYPPPLQICYSIPWYFSLNNLEAMIKEYYYGKLQTCSKLESNELPSAHHPTTTV